MKTSVEVIAEDWIVYARYPSPPKDAPEQVVADALDLGWLVEDDPEKAWEAIRYIIVRYSEADFLSREDTEGKRVVGFLSAGPLEDFLSLYGADFIDRVEDEARQDKRMAWALGGVWQCMMTDELWARVQRAALKW
jgi:hypothetical protein